MPITVNHIRDVSFKDQTANLNLATRTSGKTRRTSTP